VHLFAHSSLVEGLWDEGFGMSWRRLLITADVGLNTAAGVIERLKQKMERES